MTDAKAKAGKDDTDDVETVSAGSGAEKSNADVQSDPSGDESWSDEGGASPQGPATDPRDG